MSGRRLTERRRQILDYIAQATDERGYPPTVREIGGAVGLRSSSSVHFHLRALQEMGLLSRDGSLTRALRVVGSKTRPRAQPELRWVPVLGQVAAGSPIVADEEHGEQVALPAHLVPNGEVFMLRVEGDSMIDKGILHGDQVIVARTQTAQNGDTVVALLDDEATVKLFYRHGDQVELRPANSALAPIFTEDVRILGKVTGLVRQL